MPTLKQDPKSVLKGCISLFIMIATFCALIYFLPTLARKAVALNPIDRLTIVLSVVILAAARRK
jgi:hypothetical protein